MSREPGGDRIEMRTPVAPPSQRGDIVDAHRHEEQIHRLRRQPSGELVQHPGTGRAAAPDRAPTDRATGRGGELPGAAGRQAVLGAGDAHALDERVTQAEQA